MVLGYCEAGVPKSVGQTAIQPTMVLTHTSADTPLDDKTTPISSIPPYGCPATLAPWPRGHEPSRITDNLRRVRLDA
jgi:hypothetical protein